ncbi:MAG: helix-turn-helix transcriptional regulator [Clostridia bacterium]|nr:helix-turn-helix transcriptional regulator [Clostridia bacterium]MBQ7315675.1 helix-turn-helix transcriptional regulator [Clostridia bacterium]
MHMQRMGERIGILRQEKGMTQSVLAERLGITPQAISKWERGMSFPDLSRLEELAKMLEVSVDYLLTGKDA